jgi:hydroxymethylglutaryl-CoA lyase
MVDLVKIIECPRDAWQGLTKIIPTDAKAAYLRKLAESGFRHIDAVSFVAPKYVPQMADSEKVMERLVEAGVVRSRPNGKGAKVSEPPAKTTLEGPEIIGIVVNKMGMDRALQTPGVTTLGYPYSVSTHFRRQNANMSKAEAQSLTVELNQAARQAGRKLVVYISMAFGNPYEEPWGPELVEETLEWLKSIGVETVSLADTAGVADAKAIGDLFGALKGVAQGLELGAHLHSRPDGAAEKVLAAYEAGCRRFDCALTGLGGCPFAGDEMVGNISTEIVVQTLADRGVKTNIEPWAMLSALDATKEIRRQFGD